LVDGSAGGWTAAGGGGVKPGIEENIRRSPKRLAATAISLSLSRALEKENPRVFFEAARSFFLLLLTAPELRE